MDTQQKMHVSRALDHRHRAVSVRSFYATDGSDSDDSVVSNMSRALSQADYPMDKKGKLRSSEGDPGKSFRKKVKKMAKNERRRLDSGDDEEVEVARGAPTLHVPKGELSKLVEDALDDSADNGISIAVKQRDLKVSRMTLFAVRTAIEVQPQLLKNTMQNFAAAEKKMFASPSSRSYPLDATSIFEKNRVEDERRNAVRAGFPVPISDEEMRRMLVEGRSNTQMMQHMLYSKKFDALWKPSHTDIIVTDKKERKPENRQGWVVPLKKICEKVGLGTRFFTDNRAVSLNDARSKVLIERLTAPAICGDWLNAIDSASVTNPHLLTYMKTLFEPRVMQARLAFYLDHVEADRDRVRVSGKYYNNIHLDLFGPSKKQKVETSIVGGMERRFEILDNQVNHIPFTHDVSDANQDKCRNNRVHCRDSTRVVLSYPNDYDSTNDFIHANWVRGGPLFNSFIVTQAPMEKTVGDFWRMVWQEKVPYIFMLISRKEPERCASYWPRHINSAPIITHGLRIENYGVDETRDPLFRVTSIRIIGPGGIEHHVEHWQADMNNSSNVYSPLNLLRLARNCTNPVVVHGCLGISRAACLVSTEVAICSMIKGPTYKHLVQKAIQFVRARRPFSIETPMQFVFVHRCLMQFFKSIAGTARGFEEDYRKWLTARSLRMFVDPLDSQIPGHRMLSPKCDPDLLRQVGRPARPNYRREAPDCVGEWPVLLEETNILTPAPAARRQIEV